LKRIIKFSQGHFSIISIIFSLQVRLGSPARQTLLIADLMNFLFDNFWKFTLLFILLFAACASSRIILIGTRDMVELSGLSVVVLI